MRTFIVILAVLSGLMMASTLICGLWIRAQEQVDPSSISFHMTIALAAVLVTAVTVVMSVNQVMRLSA